MIYIIIYVNYRNPTATIDKDYAKKVSNQFPCLSQYGGPVDPNTALGGFTGNNDVMMTSLHLNQCFLC